MSEIVRLKSFATTFIMVLVMNACPTLQITSATKVSTIDLKSTFGEARGEPAICSMTMGTRRQTKCRIDRWHQSAASGWIRRRSPGVTSKTERSGTSGQASGVIGSEAISTAR